MFSLKNLLKQFALILLTTVSCAGTETISLSHKIGSSVKTGAAQCELLPVKTPEFSLELLKDSFKVTIKTPILPGEKLSCAGKKHDEERMFTGDVAEFFISPDLNSHVYYHIAANPAGLTYTAKKRDISWNPRIKTHVSRGKNFWMAEFIIPYKEINTTAPSPATKWRANFAASVKTGTAKKSCSWSGAYDFHNLSEFGTIRFDNKPLPRITVWEANCDKINIKLYLPEQYAKYKAVCEVNGTQYPAAKKGNTLSLEIPIQQNYIFPKQYSSVKLRLLSPDGKTVYSRTGRVEPENSRTLTVNSFYYTPDMKTLTYQQTFGENARILLKNANNQIIARSAAKRSGSISLAGLKPGSYIVELISGQWRTSRYIRIVPQNFAAVSIADSDRFEIKNKLFYLKNTPVFLVGASATPRNHLQFKNAFNMNTGNIGNLTNAVVFKGLGQTRFLRTPFSCSFLAKSADRIIEKNMKTNPAGNRHVHRLAYEAQIQLATGNIKAPRKIDAASYYDKLYKKLKKEYPKRYFSIHIDKAERLPDFINSCDIFEYASWRSSYAVNMMPNLNKDMKDLRRKAGKKPLIFWLGGSIPDPQCRMAEELRAAVYCALINNINGVIFHLGHGGLRQERTRLWSLISGINAEIQPIYREFASGKEIPGFVREVKGNFVYSARLCGKVIRMIAVNLEPAEQTLDMKTIAGNFKIKLSPFEPVYMNTAANILPSDR